MEESPAKDGKPRWRGILTPSITTKGLILSLVVNLFGGPGTGKSSVASDLFALMKWRKFNVELVNEYAKDLTWEKRYDILEDQLYVLAKQNRRLMRLDGQVDYMISDSPILIGAAYTPKNYYPSFNAMVEEVFRSYRNFNILLTRKKDYVAIGRNQTEKEANQLDLKIRDLMDDRDIPYVEVDADEDAKHRILDLILQS